MKEKLIYEKYKFIVHFINEILKIIKCYEFKSCPTLFLAKFAFLYKGIQNQLCKTL